MKQLLQNCQAKSHALTHINWHLICADQKRVGFRSSRLDWFLRFLLLLLLPSSFPLESFSILLIEAHTSPCSHTVEWLHQHQMLVRVACDRFAYLPSLFWHFPLAQAQIYIARSRGLPSIGHQIWETSCMGFEQFLHCETDTSGGEDTRKT